MDKVKYLVQPLKVNQDNDIQTAKESETKNKVVFAINFDDCYGFKTKEEAEIKSKELNSVGQNNVVIDVVEVMKDIGKNLVEEICMKEKMINKL